MTKHCALKARLCAGLAAALSLSLSLAPVCAGAAEDGQPAASFFAAQGCAIGPSTIASAITQGISPADIEAYSQKVQGHPQTVKTGDWLVIAPELCEIRPPSVTSEIRLSDPEVTQNLSAIDAYAEEGAPGCYLDSSGLQNALMVSRRWDREKVTLEYLRFLSASLVSGALTFYSTSNLRTPPGFAVTSGQCGGIPQMPEIRRSHDLLIQHFGALIRADAAGEATCDGGGVPSWKFEDVSRKVMGEAAPNAWLGIEIRFIAMGAGWYEGMTAQSKGEPRPPLCRYE